MGDRVLRATSCLADNSWPLLAAAVGAVRATGRDIVVVADLEPGDADVVFACGLLTRELIATGAPLEIVAAPIFPGERRPVYRSFVVTRESGPDDLATASTGQLAVNDYGSWSGWHAYLTHLAEQGLPSPSADRRTETGGHQRSMDAVAAGTCDIAAIDSSVWHDSRAAGLKVIATTRDWPAPPFSLATSIDDEVREAVVSLPDVVAATAATYDEMLTRSRDQR